MRASRIIKAAVCRIPASWFSLLALSLPAFTPLAICIPGISRPDLISMRDKETDPEAPVASQHIERTIFMEKEKIASDAEIAQTWSHDVIKRDEKTKQKNPLAGLTKEELMADVEAFAREKDLEHILDDLKKGALVAQDPKAFESLDELSEEEKELLRRETTHKWHQPFMMYFMTSTFQLRGTSFSVSDPVQSSSLRRLGNRAGNGPDCSQWCPRVCLSYISHPGTGTSWLTIPGSTLPSSELRINGYKVSSTVPRISARV